MSTQLCLGLDLGTTNSAGTLINGELIELTIPGSRDQVLSCVYYDLDDKSMVGLPGFNASYKHPDRLAKHFKRRLYDSPGEPVYCGHSAIECTSLIIAELLKVAKKAEPELAKCLREDGADRSKLKVVLAVPANWGTTQHQSLREAAMLAGIHIDAVLPEPAVAARRVLYEKRHRLKDGQQLAVIDFGGGTFDLAAFKSRQRVLDSLIAARGDEYLGGDNITGLIFREFCDRLRLKHQSAFDDKHGLQLNQLGSQAKAQQALKLWELAERAKEELSTAETSTVFYDGKRTPQELTLMREEYLSISKPLWERFEQALSSMLEGTTLGWSDFEHIVLVGGSAMAYGTAESVCKVTGRPVEDILISAKPTHVVATGCALAGAYPDHGDSAIARGIGIRVATSAEGGSYTNRMFFGTGHICPREGEAVESAGQCVNVHDEKCLVSLQFVEAAPGVVVPEPTPGVPTLLDDREVCRLRQIATVFEDLPPGEHEIRVGFSVDPNGEIHYHLVPLAGGCEGVHGTLQADGTQSDCELPSRFFEHDVLILLDVSGSMRKHQKLEHAKQAVEKILPQMNGHNLSVGLITFGQEVQVAARLGTSPEEIRRAVGGAIARGGTPMAGAIRRAREEFGERKSDSKRLALLTTDGRPASARQTEEEAKRLKEFAEIYCIGIGYDVDHALLRRIASAPDRYWHADRSELVPTLFGAAVELFLSDDPVEED